MSLSQGTGDLCISLQQGLYRKDLFTANIPKPKPSQTMEPSGNGTRRAPVLRRSGPGLITFEWPLANDGQSEGCFKIALALSHPGNASEAGEGVESGKVAPL